MDIQKFQPRVLSRSVVVLMVALAHQQVAGSDASIYTNPGPTAAKSTAMFLLDNSGSMSFDDSYDGVTDPKDGSKDVRINRLKKAMQRVLVGDSTGEKLIPVSNNDFNVGLSHFTTAGTGRIATPALLSQDRAVVPSATGTLGATTLYPSSTTFKYVNRRDAVGSFSNNADLMTANDSYNQVGNFYVDKNNSAYLRFHADIPKNATIKSAKLVLPYIPSTSKYDASRVYASLEDVGHAQPLSTNKSTMSSRFSGASSVNNSVLSNSSNPLGRNSTTVMTFDVQNLLIPQVKRSDWCGMNALDFRLSATNNTEFSFFVAGIYRDGDYYYGSESIQPYLEVTWEVTSAVRASTCMGKRTERQINSPKWVADDDYITNLDQMNQRHYVNLETQRLIAETGTPTARAYAEVTAYLMGTTTNELTGSGYSLSSDSAKTAAGTAGTYNSPLPPNTGTGSVDSSCISNGIFTLTDGQPNGNASTPPLAKKSLGGSNSLSCTDEGSGWDCILNTAKLLFPSNGNTADNARTTNAKTYPIRSIVVGFGDNSFWDGKNVNALNAQTWGSKDYGGGLKKADDRSNPPVYETGFKAAESKQDVVDFAQRFFNIIDNNSGISSNGSGVAPGTVGTGNTDTRYVYFPLFDPKIDEPFWAGNVKRYEVKESGTTRSLVDKTGTTKVLVDINQSTPTASAGSLFNKLTKDLWNASTDENDYDGGNVLKGGLVSKMSQPRRLFVDMSSSGTEITKGDLNQVSYDLDSTAQQTLINSLTTALNPINPLLSLLPTPTALTHSEKQGYTKNYLWWLLNHDVKDLSEGVGVTGSTRTATILNRMGGVFHSAPEVITTKITSTKYTQNGQDKISTSQTDYLIFGTMQGLVHVVEASTGAEQFVFAPTELLNKAKTMLKPSSQVVSGTSLAPAPLFYGMDGAWTAYVDRETEKVGNVDTIKATKINAYGGMRMGGSSYYGLDLTGLGGNGAITPKVLFKITPSSTGFDRLGQTWSQPVVANIRVNGARKRVIIFGGGYDPKYENVDTNGIPTYVPGSASGGEIGNAVYIADAETGALIYTISNQDASSTLTKVDDMKYSIPSTVKTADRNADGLIDHIYVGDLGGQVFRIDINNYPATAGSLVRRVSKLADFNPTDKVNGVRFYEPPSFAPTNDSLNGIKVGLLSIGSGNKSFPMLKTTQDYTFMLFDWDVMNNDLYTRTIEVADPATDFSKVVQLKDNVAKSTLSSVINQTASASTRKNGWYYALPSSTVSSPTTSTTSGAKALVRTTIVDYVLNTTVFDPTRNNDTCGAGIKGATTTYRICLPFGACGTNSNTDIRTTYLGAGIGQPLLVGSITDGLTYANDTSLTGSNSSNPKVGTALKDEYNFNSKVEPMHRWREVTSEKYK